MPYFQYINLDYEDISHDEPNSDNSQNKFNIRPALQ